MRTAATALAIVSLGCLLTACRHPTEVAQPRPAPSVISQDPLAPPGTFASPEPIRPRASPSRSGSPSPSGFSEAYVTYCNGRPSGEQVVAVVRRNRANLPAGNGVAVWKAPVCSGTWQYTVLTVTGSEPLRVITKGDPAALTVVTMGSDPCTAEVRATAPPALLATVDC
ncbi:hypothetical protein ABT297_07610 [Dactylosporangium sp. NPDC000555]|uniref:hypothetical protein n=1 Tax=Dactylosporangium sp. NPDC000555 TaxID=3154260 RepID=UPI00331D96BA